MRPGDCHVKARRCTRWHFGAIGCMSAPQPVQSAPVPRPASSLLVVRHDDDGPRLLMGKRSAGHRFMPNVLVFPGGAVDPADHHARAATPLRPAVRARLDRTASPSLAQALAIAAARELTEEVGLSLGEPPALGDLEYCCRAITPPDRSMRFDAHFFIVDASRLQGTLLASAELETPAWYTLEEAEMLDLAHATRAVLGQFRRWLAHHDRDGLVPTLQNRVWTMT
jgi:8-oxo-dGTP pyrophosphatase MutT (NUDIX family)